MPNHLYDHWMDLDSLVLPPYKRHTMQPQFPCTSRIVLARTIADASGHPITYRVRTTGQEWWVSATLRGFRASATIHTTIELRAKIWMLAIENGKVRVGETGRWTS